MTDPSDDRQLLDELYLPPKDRFVTVNVPEMRFLVVDGSGGHDAEEFTAATRWLISAIQPLKPLAKERMGARYVEPPLEVLWRADDMRDLVALRRDKLTWRQMIIMGHWVDDAMIDQAVAASSERLGEPPDSLRLDRFAEGPSVQIMHIGTEDDARPTIDRLYGEFLPEQGLVPTGSFHEIYLSDPKRVTPENTRTVLRQPVTPATSLGDPSA